MLQWLAICKQGATAATRKGLSGRVQRITRTHTGSGSRGAACRRIAGKRILGLPLAQR